MHHLPLYVDTFSYQVEPIEPHCWVKVNLELSPDGTAFPSSSHLSTFNCPTLKRGKEFTEIELALKTIYITISEFPFYYQAFCAQGISRTLVINYTLTPEKDMANIRNRWGGGIKGSKVLRWQRLCKCKGRLFSNILSTGIRRFWSAI